MHLLLSLLCLLFWGCSSTPEKIEPQLDYYIHENYIKKLPSAFKPLSLSEKGTDWGREYLIGERFAKKLDLYQAVTAFKRAEILIPDNLYERKLEIEYYILLSYYFGKRYNDVIYAFENSNLAAVQPTFPAYNDLLIILYESYLEEGMEDKAQRILTLIEGEAGEKLAVTAAFSTGDVEGLHNLSESSSLSYLRPFLNEYEMEKKSVRTAKALNILPGAGYLYLGQKKSALTAFLLNGLFIWATAHFFIKGNIAAGAIFASFEAGWYFGGIYGAGEEAVLYNERLFECKASQIMNERGLFPAVMIKYAF